MGGAFGNPAAAALAQEVGAVEPSLLGDARPPEMLLDGDVRPASDGIPVLVVAPHCDCDTVLGLVIFREPEEALATPPAATADMELTAAVDTAADAEDCGSRD